MSEYIEKSELLETLKEFKPDINDFDWANAECEHIQEERYQAKLDMFMDLISIIERIPTKDCIPVIYAHWIECDYKYLEHGFIETDVNAGLCCSNCRTAFRKKKITYKSFCPYCGAKMDEEIE